MNEDLKIKSLTILAALALQYRPLIISAVNALLCMSVIMLIFFIRGE